MTTNYTQSINELESLSLVQFNFRVQDERMTEEQLAKFPEGFVAKQVSYEIIYHTMSIPKAQCS